MILDTTVIVQSVLFPQFLQLAERVHAKMAVLVQRMRTGTMFVHVTASTRGQSASIQVYIQATTPIFTLKYWNKNF